MVYVVVLMLMLAAIAVVAWPLLNSAKTPVVADGELNPELEELASQRDSAYRAIKELEFEHQLGNLSQEDYQALRERYRTEAAGVLRQLERARRPGKQTAARARAISPAAPARSASEVATATDGRACPTCNKSVPAGDHFCRYCGAPLERVCPTCRSPRPFSDVFCGACGAPLEGSA